MNSPWTRFRNLCRYYADCVKYSEKSQEFLFPRQRGIGFIVPRLPQDWHISDRPFFVETGDADSVFIGAVAKRTRELTIEYPLHVFKAPSGGDCLCPIMLFPVSVRVDGNGLRMMIDRKGISINHEWVTFRIHKNEQPSFLHVYEEAIDAVGNVDVGLVLRTVAAQCGNATFDPNTLISDMPALINWVGSYGWRLIEVHDSQYSQINYPNKLYFVKKIIHPQKADKDD